MNIQNRPAPARTASKPGMTGSSAANSSVSRRLDKELRDLMGMVSSGELKGVSAFPEESNKFHWAGSLAGPSGSPYEGQDYKIKIVFTSGYPFKAPTVVFKTPCFHPNVDQFGGICLDILKDKWEASYDVGKILLSLQILLAHPNVDSPLNGQAATLWEQTEEYTAVNAKKYVEAIESGVDLTEGQVYN